MKPIDVVRNKIDSDLIRFHGTTLCRIADDTDIKSVRGVGICAMVSIVDQLGGDSGTSPTPQEKFPVMIVNRPMGWIDSNVSIKYYVVVINTVPDRSSMSVGFLVPITGIRDFDSINPDTGEFDDIDGKPLEASQKESVADAKLE